MDEGDPVRVNPFNSTSDVMQTGVLNLYIENNDKPQIDDNPCIAERNASFFEDLFPDVCALSSVEKLEAAVMHCKHIYLASGDQPKHYQQYILDRLIELRRLLHNAKERERYGGSCQLSRASLPALSSETDLQAAEYTAHYSDCVRLLGHKFQPVLAFRFLGAVCESCCRMVKGPAGRILVCGVCGIACHDSTSCTRGLIRQCPAASVLNYTLAGDGLTQPVRGQLPPTGPTPKTTTTRPRLLSHRIKSHSISSAAADSNRHPNVSSDVYVNPETTHQLLLDRLTYVEASLSAQAWRCWECGARLSANLEMDLGKLTCSTGRHSRPPPALLAAVRRLEAPHALKASEYGRQKRLLGVGEVAGLFSPALGPILSDADVAVVRAAGKLPDVSSTCSTDGDDDAVVEKRACPAQLCYYFGRYYCTNCHWGDFWKIPANIFILGLCTAYPVSRPAFLSLNFMWTRQQFRAPPAWQRWNPKALLTCSLRLRAFRLNAYFRICKKALETKQKFECHQPSWILEQPYTYTMWTVERVLDGSLPSALEALLRETGQHVETCELCMSFGQSICSVCRKPCPQPHQHLCAVCFVCWNATHRACLQPAVDADPQDIAEIEEAVAMLVSSSEDSLCREDVIEVFVPVLRVTCQHCAKPPADCSVTA